MTKKIKQIVILNGGDGKRVKKLIKNRPKCLIKFYGHSFLSLQLNKPSIKYLKTLKTKLSQKM